MVWAPTKPLFLRTTLSIHTKGLPSCTMCFPCLCNSYPRCKAIINNKPDPNRFPRLSIVKLTRLVVSDGIIKKTFAGGGGGERKLLFSMNGSFHHSNYISPVRLSFLLWQPADLNESSYSFPFPPFFIHANNENSVLMTMVPFWFFRSYFSSRRWQIICCWQKLFFFFKEILSEGDILVGCSKYSTICPPPSKFCCA